ncbi:MAG TPA: hypothetical protein VM452_02065 [Caulifigura sp.]|nr:hypothetical protein [Caulifigura sp.]
MTTRLGSRRLVGMIWRQRRGRQQQCGRRGDRDDGTKKVLDRIAEIVDLPRTGPKGLSL